MSSTNHIAKTTLPESVFSNHNISQKNGNLVCLTPGCKFYVKIENAQNYIDNKYNICDFVTRLADGGVKELQQRIIAELQEKMKTDQLVAPEAADFLHDFLTSAVTPIRTHALFSVAEDAISKNIDRLNQICPFTQENFQSDFLAGKYVDRSKLMHSISASDFADKTSKGFLTNNFDAIQSFIKQIFLTNVSNLEVNRVVLTQQGNITVVVKIVKPNTFPEQSFKDHFQYLTRDIELGSNGSEAFKKLKTEAITDIAILKFKLLNYSAFVDITNVYISNWSGAKDFITIDTYSNGFISKRNISVSSFIDANSCEINLEKFKEVLSQNRISYNTLIDKTPREGEFYDEIDN